MQQQLQNINPLLNIHQITLPEEHTLNNMLVNYGADAILQLVQENKITENKPAVEPTKNEGLVQVMEGKLSFTADTGIYYISGALPTDLSSLKVMLHFENLKTKSKQRVKIDLYTSSLVEAFIKLVSDAEGIDYNDVQRDILKLTDLLENYREKQLEHFNPLKRKIVKLLPPDTMQPKRKEIKPSYH
jgi:hypothetical protein